MEDTSEECNLDEELQNVLQNINDAETPEIEDVPKMSRWARIQQSQTVFEQIQEIYSQGLPIEVRHFFADWIEMQPWEKFQEGDVVMEGCARRLLSELINMLEEKSNNAEDPFFVRLKLKEIVNMFKQTYEPNPMAFVYIVKQCLQMEEALLQYAENSEMVDTGIQSDDTSVQINRDFEKLTARTAKTDQELKRCQEQQESFIIRYQDNLKVNEQIQKLDQQQQTTQINNVQTFQNKKKQLLQQKGEIEQQLIQKAQQLLQLRIQLADTYVETVNELTDVQSRVVDYELIKWKVEQKMAGNGAKFESSLMTIQIWCETLAEIIWSNRQQIKKLLLLRVQLPIDLPQGKVDHLPTLMENVTSLLSSLVTGTFIVETQPPQVMKKDSRFSASVRLLVGGKLNVHMNPPHVKATIISECQAKNLMQSDIKAKKEVSGEILNNMGTMEYNQTSGQLGINFRNMQLKRIKRADRKGTDAVTEEKFCILFQSDFSVGGNELVFQVWTLSLPVVVTVHGNQEANALATILWDNAFSEHGRIPFQVPDAVQWSKLAEQLNIKFQSGTGRGLSTENIQYLASKIFNDGIKEDYTSRLVTWSQFNKDTLPTRNFTFWEWFYAMLKLTMQHLKDQWNDGSIIGFVSKVQAQEWLLAQTNGTFLLRFSDSEIGGITIAWMAQGQGDAEVWNLAPFVTKDFTIRSLSDRIKDLSNLVYLYPNIPKSTAFGKYYTITQEQPIHSVDGYIRPHLVNVINWNQHGAVMNMDNPQTPVASSTYESPAHSNWSDQQPLSVESLPDNFDMQDLMQINTDYNPDDIDSVNVNDINVNELLTNCYSMPPV